MKFNIEKWKEIAKKYGCVFDNIDFVLENDLFVKAIALDKTKKFYLKVPFPVLVYADEEIVIEDDKHFIKSKIERPKELEDVINEYLDFIFSPKRVEYLTNLLEQINNLPVNVKQKLKRIGLLNLLNYPLEKKEIKRKLFNARTLKKGEKRIFMPFVDFLNHDYIDGRPYEGEEDEVVVEGLPSQSGEIFAIYNMGDSFHFLNTYFFVPKPFIAYSIPFGMNIGNNKKLNVFRNFSEFELVCNNQLKIPKFKIEFQNIELLYLWLGSHHTPRRPFWSFQYVWERKFGRKDTVKIYSLIKSANLEFLIDLMKDLDKLERNTAVDLLKEATFNQIKLISETFEDTTERLC